MKACHRIFKITIISSIISINNIGGAEDRDVVFVDEAIACETVARDYVYALEQYQIQIKRLISGRALEIEREKLEDAQRSAQRAFQALPESLKGRKLNQDELRWLDLRLRGANAAEAVGLLLMMSEFDKKSHACLLVAYLRGFDDRMPPEGFLGSGMTSRHKKLLTVSYIFLLNFKGEEIELSSNVNVRDFAIETGRRRFGGEFGDSRTFEIYLKEKYGFDSFSGWKEMDVLRQGQ